MSQISSSMKSRPAALALGLVLGVAGLGFAHTIQKSAASTKTGATDKSASNPPATLKLAEVNEGASKTTFAPIVKAVLPSVVNISSSKVVKGQAKRPRCRWTQCSGSFSARTVMNGCPRTAAKRLLDLG